MRYKRSTKRLYQLSNLGTKLFYWFSLYCFNASPHGIAISGLLRLLPRTFQIDPARLHSKWHTETPEMHTDNHANHYHKLDQRPPSNQTGVDVRDAVIMCNVIPRHRRGGEAGFRARPVTASATAAPSGLMRYRV